MTISQSLTVLFSNYPQYQTDPQAVARAYMIALDGIQAEFVEAAVVAFVQGRVSRNSSARAPSGEELAIEARRQRDLAGIAAHKKITPSPEKPIDPEERARVASLMAGLAKSILPAQAPKTAQTRKQIEAELRAMASEPVRVSAALLGKLNGSK